MPGYLAALSDIYKASVDRILTCQDNNRPHSVYVETPTEKRLYPVTHPLIEELLKLRGFKITRDEKGDIISACWAPDRG